MIEPRQGKQRNRQDPRNRLDVLLADLTFRARTDIHSARHQRWIVLKKVNG